MSTISYAHVIIDNPSSQVDMEFDYIIPSGLKVLPGVRVKVPFGIGNKLVLGIVLEVSEETFYSKELKEIVEVLDLEPILSNVEIELAQYIKSETICPISRILNQMIPASKRLKTVQYLQIINGSNIDANLLKEFKGETIQKLTPRFNKYEKVIKALISSGDLKIVKDALERKVNKWTKKYFVNINNYNLFFNNLKNNKSKELLLYMLRVNKPLTMDEILEDVSISEYLVQKLVKMELLDVSYELTSKIKTRVLSTKINTLPDIMYLNKYINTYNTEQKLLYLANNKIEEQAFIKKIIDENIKQDKNTLIVVPDILRSYEVYTYLKKLLNVSICNLNQDITDDELYEYYENVLNNTYQVIVTTPGCALWPYKNLGCILLMDQESKNYRNDQSPRYDLNQVMNKKSGLLNTKLIYHSYAPLLKTYTDSMLGKLMLLYTPSVVNNNITIVDMMEALRKMESFVISNVLKERMKNTFDESNAVLLILNNKSYSKSVSCRVCGHTFTCKKCRIPLQYNKDKHEMYCPACYTKEKETINCPKCFSEKLAYEGIGMLKVEEEITKMFPSKKVKILKDSNYLELEEIIDDLNENNLDIIITSETFSKSIESNRLKLVGIIDFDVLLNYPSFDANHLAYSMLSNTNQILKDGEIVIQTKNPKHFVLKNFIINNYDEYYFEELNNRKTLKVEPLYEVNRILVKGDYNQVFKVANNIKKTLLNIIKDDLFVIGPSYNFREKKVQLIVKHKNPNINKIYMKIYELYQKTNIVIIFDRYSKIIT